jgi:membrane-bound lytic murein transglycosylase B
MRFRLPAALSVALLLASCTTSEPAPTSQEPPTAVSSQTGAASPNAPGGTAAEVWTPAVDEPVPERAPALARALARTTDELEAAIEAWRARPGPPRRAPLRVLLLGAYEQELYRELGRHPALLSRVVPRLAPPLRDRARVNSAAIASLLSLITPSEHVPDLKLGPPPPAGELLGYYEEAERRFGIPWEVLAAIHFVETKFSRVRDESSAGAQGPMQFIPSTWAAYGMGGNVHDLRDAIMGAANYLRASSYRGNHRAAVFNYNHADEYVDAVLAYADEMGRDRSRFFAYYTWQVHALTETGDVRLSDPTD